MSNFSFSLNKFFSFLNSISSILIAILVLLLMITIHELGHYVFGKILKFKINEFAIGFGKVLFSKTNKSGEKVSLRLIPLGGFCAFEGEDANSENPDAFNNKEPWKRLIVLFGGVLFNFLSAIIFSVILLAVIGNGRQVVTSVQGPNAEVLKTNDIILEVNDKKTTFLSGGLSGITQNVGLNEKVTLTIKRDGQIIEVTVYKYEFTEVDTVTGEQVTQVKFGVALGYLKLNFGQALVQATPFCFEVAWDCLVILGRLFTGQISIKQVGGPITTIGAIATASSYSLLNLLLLIPLIAVNLAVFNLLPIPALDGARMVFVLIEWIRGKPINRDLEAKIHAIGLIILFSLVIIIDILHLLS